MKIEEIKEMGIIEKSNAINYCWNTYTNRRVDYAMSGGRSKKPLPPFRSIVPRRPQKRVHYIFKNETIDNYVRKEGVKV